MILFSQCSTCLLGNFQKNEHVIKWFDRIYRFTSKSFSWWCYGTCQKIRVRLCEIPPLHSHMRVMGWPFCVVQRKLTFQHYEAQIKWLPYCRQHFQNYFLGWQLYFDSNFSKFSQEFPSGKMWHSFITCTTFITWSSACVIMSSSATCLPFWHSTLPQSALLGAHWINYSLFLTFHYCSLFLTFHWSKNSSPRSGILNCNLKKCSSLWSDLLSHEAVSSTRNAHEDFFHSFRQWYNRLDYVWLWRSHLSSISWFWCWKIVHSIKNHNHL